MSKIGLHQLAQSAAADGDIPTWDDAAGLWVPGAPSSGGAVATDPIWDAKGDLAVSTGSDAAARLAVGSDGQVLTADAAEATGVKWATPSGGVTWTSKVNDSLASLSGFLTPIDGTWTIAGGVTHLVAASFAHMTYNADVVPSAIRAVQVECAYGASGSSERRMGIIMSGKNAASADLLIYLYSSNGTTWGVKCESDGTLLYYTSATTTYAGSGYIALGVIQVANAFQIYLNGVYFDTFQPTSVGYNLNKRVGLYGARITADFRNLKAWTLLSSPF